MTFLFPAFLWAAGAVSLGVVVLHFLVTRQPKSDVLPTVRFFPDVPARSTSVAIRPSDMLLLLTRVLTIMLIGAAFAQPVLTPKHTAVARIVAVDVSRAVGSPAELADSARRYAPDAAAVVWFDSAAREVPVKTVGDSIAAVTRGGRAARRGALTPALIAMNRAAARVRDRADSIEMVVVSPFAQEEFDAATPAVRALFPGHVRAVRVTAAAADSAAVRARAASVTWLDSARTGAPAGWTALPKGDTIGAVRVGDAVMVSPFARRWRYAGPVNQATRVAGRWMDGEPAVVEQLNGGQCTRTVAFSMPVGGDVALRPDYARLLDAIRAPCGALQNFAPVAPEAIAALEGGPQLASVTAVKPRITRMTPLVPWLLAGALALALLELLVRRISGSASENEDAGAAAPRQAVRREAA